MSALLDSLVEQDDLIDDDFAEQRRLARQQLMQHGFPDLKTEAWKYTSLRSLQKRDFEAMPTQSSEQPSLPFDADVLHLDQGLLDPEQVKLPPGVRLEPLAALDPETLNYAQQSDAFAWLNLARFEQAWKLVIDQTLERPLALVTTTSADFAAAVHPRLVVEMSANASATLIDLLCDQGQGLINSVQDIRLGNGARLEHVLVRNNAESAAIQRTRVRVGSDADYRCHVLDQGGRLNRHDLTIELRESGASGQIDGVALIDTDQHVDYHTAIEHVVGKTNSRESFRMLAGGTGVGVFNGRIHIHRGADDSHSDLNTANLLLSDTARINIKPELEIYAEEVTASHGATIGQIDETAMFYMRSRGIPEAEALSLLKQGFAATPLESLDDQAIRDWLLEKLKKHL